jgi:hypothetical protein
VDSDVGAALRTQWAGGRTRDDIARMQSEDPEIGILTKLYLKPRTRSSRDSIAAQSLTVRHVWLQWEQLKLKGGVMYRPWISDNKSQSCLQLLVL